MTWEEAVKSSSLQVAYRVDEDVVHFRFPRTGTVEMRLGEPLVVENLYDRMDDWLPFGMTRTLRSSDVMVAQSRALRSQFSAA